MSGRIHSLSDATINQIAAGEVVERPGSVVKELMENAFDAGATRVEVDAEDGGRKLLRVRDDGCGMDRADALKSIERHATSKLNDISDLDSIRSMGFRGEALSSISAVSQFTLATAEEGAAEGTELVVFGGRIQRADPLPPVKGTAIQVRNLFFNIPARRKFLRTAATEFVHVRSAFVLEAIAHPEVECVLRADGEEVYRLPPAATLADRVRDIFGGEVSEHLQAFSWDNGVVRISGLAGIPPFARADRAWQIVTVNGRPASSPVIQYAIQTAYRGMLPAGRFAPLFVAIDLPGPMVDVNVHPAKKEVRFRRPNEVRDGLVEALQNAVQGSPDRSRTFRAPQSPTARATWEQHPAAAPAAAEPPASPAVPVLRPAAQQASFALPTSAEKGDEDALPGAFAHAGRLAGRLSGGFLLVETDRGLVVVDERNARERILFDQLERAREGVPVPSQGLLPPAAVTLSAPQAEALRRHLEAIRPSGFDIRPMGGDTFLVESLPAFLSGGEAAPFLSDLAEALLRGGTRGGEEYLSGLLAETAARRACAPDRELSREEAEALLASLAATRNPFASPRGRPTAFLASFGSLHRKFGRDA